MISEKSCSNEVYMQLEGRAHDKHRSMAGKYTMANGFSSGMPYWEESAGTYALVFTKGNWSIGKKSDLGTTTQYLYSTNSPLCPESIGSNWKYFDGEEWLDAQGNVKMYKYEGMIHQANKQLINVK